MIVSKLLISLLCLWVSLAMAADKPTESIGSGSDDSKTMLSDPRNGEPVDQIAEESRVVAEVAEAEEKSYAVGGGNGGPPPQAGNGPGNNNKPSQHQGPPPIPVPVPVKVRPGAVVLPSPGGGHRNNNKPNGYKNHGGNNNGGDGFPVNGGGFPHKQAYDNLPSPSAPFPAQELVAPQDNGALDLPPNMRGPPMQQRPPNQGPLQQQQPGQPPYAQPQAQLRDPNINNNIQQQQQPGGEGPGHGKPQFLGQMDQQPHLPPPQGLLPPPPPPMMPHAHMLGGQGPQNPDQQLNLHFNQNGPPQRQPTPPVGQIPPQPQQQLPQKFQRQDLLQHQQQQQFIHQQQQLHNQQQQNVLVQLHQTLHKPTVLGHPQQKASNVPHDIMVNQASNSLPQQFGGSELGGAGVVPAGSPPPNFPGFPAHQLQPQADDSWPQPAPDMPQILHLEAKCEKDMIKVALKFDRPFFGVIFSKGNYDNEKCVYLRPGLGRSSATFDIAINGCGTIGNTQNGLYGYGEQSGSGSFFENTVIVQYDPFVQEVWDQARKLRCSWHDYYEKSVTFKPFNVEMLPIVNTDFAGDNVGCWMQIQTGKGPWANEVSGIVKIGQTLTMTLAIKDEENKFDMLVRDCVAHDGKRNPIELVDSRGCIVRQKLMSKFSKIKNFGTSASVLSYAHFQAFKFPDSMDVHFQCTIQICRHQCPEQCAQPIEGPAALRGGETVSSEILAKPTSYMQSGRPRYERSVTFRLRRSTSDNETDADAVTRTARAKSIGVNGNIKVVSTGDLAFSLESANGSASASTATVVYPVDGDSSGLICISTPSFTITMIFLLSILVISCIVSTFLCIRHRTYATSADSGSSLSGSSSDDIYKPKPAFYEFLRRGRN